MPDLHAEKHLPYLISTVGGVADSVRRDPHVEDARTYVVTSLDELIDAAVGWRDQLIAEGAAGIGAGGEMG